MTEYEFRVRRYQRPFHETLVTGKRKRAIEIAHRRWGKDEITLAATRELAMKRPGSYWHCLPEYEQARKAIWTAVNPHTGKRRIDEAFPPEIRESKDEQQMFIRLRNGSTWQIIGSDRYNSLVGAGVCGVVFSEWALANPSSWGYIRPMIEENDGWAAFITTPRGRNHAHGMLEHARANPDVWFSEVSSIKDTGALTQHQLDEARAEYVALYGADLGNAQFEQEYYCSFDAAIPGAFYGSLIAEAEKEGRIRVLPREPDLPVHTAWDLGHTDSTAIWFAQVAYREIRLVDYYEAAGVGIDHYIKVLQDKPHIYGHHFLPHDAKPKQLTSDESVLDTLIRLGMPRDRTHILANQSRQDGINAARNILPRCFFHAENCARGIDALRQYRREWDDRLKNFRLNPLHDWTSHGADAFRYLALGLAKIDYEDDGGAWGDDHEAEWERSALTGY